MHNFRKIIRWAAFALFMMVLLPIIVSVVGEFFIELAREKGLYSDPSNRLDAAMIALTVFVTQTWLLVAAGFFGGLAAGLWLDVILRHKLHHETVGVPVSKEVLKKGASIDSRKIRRRCNRINGATRRGSARSKKKAKKRGAKAR